MKPSPMFWPLILGLGVLSSAFFAADRYFAQNELQQRLNDEFTLVQEAQDLTTRHPKVFAQKTAQSTNLKQLVQSAGAKHGVTVAYLSETTRESGDKMNERSVVVRAKNVGHSNLIHFLSEIEQQGNGARLKDIRVKQDAVRTGVYHEAEAILAVKVPRTQD